MTKLTKKIVLLLYDGQRDKQIFSMMTAIHIISDFYVQVWSNRDVGKPD